MKSSIKKLEKSIVELTIEESKENILKYRKNVIDKLRKESNIKGFRKGSNIPEDLIVRHYGEEKIFSLIVEEALNKVYTKALKHNNILPMAQGNITQIVSQDPLIIKIQVENLPSVEINENYKKIRLKKTMVEIKDDEVELVLKEIQQKFVKFEKADQLYKSKMGDKLYINTQGYDLMGNKLENTNMSNYPLVLGSNILVSGFEKGLLNKSIGEKVNLDIHFPKDYYDENYKDKKTKFEVEILNIEISIMPEFTPEFIKNLRGKDLDLNGFKLLIKNELLEKKEMEIRLLDENKLIEELLKVSNVDYGDSLFKNHNLKIFEEIKNNIINSGAKVSDYINSLGLNEEEYIDQYVKSISIKRLKAELILNELLKLEKTELSENEINLEIENIISKFGSEEVVKRLREIYKPGLKHYEELTQKMKYRKLIDSFFE